MYNKRSDYALNKKDPEAIVCTCANGELIRLTKQDFVSEDEFERWKRWSDENYHTEEKNSRPYEDHRVAFCEQLDTITPSVETLYKETEEQAERMRIALQQFKILREHLTETQIRRLLWRYVDGLSVTEIASREGVSKAAITMSLQGAVKKARKFLKMP